MQINKYSYKNHFDMDISCCVANNLQDLINFIQDKKIYVDLMKTSFRIEDSLEEIIEKIVGGDKKNFDNMKAKFNKEKLSDSELIQKKKLKYTCGYKPIIPLVLESRPNCMLYNKKQVIPKKIINLFIDATTSALISNENRTKKFTEMLLLVKQWEMQGYRVKINLLVTGATLKEKQFSLVIIPLKDPDKLLSLARFSYCLGNSDFSRAIMYTCENFAREKVFGISFFESSYVIKNPYKGEMRLFIAEHFGGNNTRILFLDYESDLSEFKL